MAYGLGIDVGTTFTASAVRRDSRVETVELGDRAAAIPSVLYLGVDGSVQVGEAADRRALQEPGRLAREFKRRVGDAAPLILGGSTHLLKAEVLRTELSRSFRSGRSRPACTPYARPR